MSKIGEINNLKVLRETDIGFMLDSKDGEIFLHKNESNYRELKKGEIVSAFLYFDQKGRLAATLKDPLLTVSKPAFLEVADVLENLGVFLHMGISKDVLLSKDDLPINKNEWPRVGSKLFVRLVVKGKLVAKIVDPKDIIDNQELEVGKDYHLYVQKIGNQGLNLLGENFEKVFVHSSMFRENYYLGEKVLVKVLNQTEKGYSGTLLKAKEDLRIDDADIILEYLMRRKEMPLDSKSSSEDVSKIFNMSKKAFKRALGHLYKERKIDFIGNKTILIDGDKNER
ncbi:MAG: S1-like domain-containing RNA-binding protein [Acholeplasma sp.]|nr:S1-like domain-containing RNA-binding protein [Acholeplasma sp.]